MADAKKLSFALTGRGFWQGFEAPLPTRTELVRDLLSDEVTYSLLSAVTHGDIWALMSIGFVPTGTAEGGGQILEKQPPVTGLQFAAVPAFKAVARAVWADMTYRDWNVDQITSALNAAFTAAGLADREFFWLAAE